MVLSAAAVPMTIQRQLGFVRQKIVFLFGSKMAEMLARILDTVLSLTSWWFAPRTLYSQFTKSLVIRLDPNKEPQRHLSCPAHSTGGLHIIQPKRRPTCLCKQGIPVLPAIILHAPNSNVGIL